MKSPPPTERTRNASALLLRRGPEIYLAQRSPALGFFGGFFAAVGGAVDAVDGEGPDRFARAALRECFEEIGLPLFADPSFQAGGHREHRQDPGRWASLQGQLRTEDLGPPVCRLVTPAFYPRCFDTRFFFADTHRALEKPWQAEPDGRELVEGRWEEPARWLELWSAGELLIVPPLVLILRRLVEIGMSAETHEESIRAALGGLGEWIESHPAQPIWNSPLARLVYLRTPTQPPAQHTNCYLVGRDPAYVVDPSSPHETERNTLLRCLEEEIVQGRRFEAILLTHDHPDHVGAAGWLREQRGLPIWAHPETRRSLGSRLPIDRDLDDGEDLPLGGSPKGAGGWNLRCLHTPGHARGHLCFMDDAYGDLIAGDMVSTLSSILIDPTDGDLGEYEASLRRLAELGPRVVMPAHGPADGRGRALLDHQRRHRQSRSEQILDVVHAGATSVDQIVEQVYAAVPAPQRALAGRSVISILRHLYASGRWTRVDHDLAEESGILRRS